MNKYQRKWLSDMSNCRKLLIDKIREIGADLNKTVEKEQEEIDNAPENFQFSKKADELQAQADELVNIVENLERLYLN